MDYYFIRQPIAPSSLLPTAYELLVRGTDGLACSVLRQVYNIRQVDLDALELAIALSVDGLRYHVNCSKQTVGDWVYFARLGKARREGVNPKAITIEVSEDLVPSEDARFWLRSVQDMGFPICLDDFGRAHSNNLAYSMYLPDILKIDGEFVRNIESSCNAELVEKEMAFCKKRRIACIAEHVENEKILAKLQTIAHSIGFSDLHYQGWFIGRGERVRP